MECHVLVEELREALGVLAAGDGSVAGDGGLDAAGMHARHLYGMLGDQHLWRNASVNPLTANFAAL
jgi:hypothetical protein